MIAETLPVFVLPQSFPLAIARSSNEISRQGHGRKKSERSLRPGSDPGIDCLAVMRDGESRSQDRLAVRAGLGARRRLRGGEQARNRADEWPEPGGGYSGYGCANRRARRIRGDAWIKCTG